MAENIQVNEKELAEYLGLSDRRIRQLVQEGIVVKSKRGRYDLKLSVKGYINSIRTDKKVKNESIDKVKLAREVELLQHDKLKKRKTELIVRQMENKMHIAEDVEYFWNTMILAAKSKLTAIPTKISPRLIGLNDIKEIQKILKREIDDALNEISKYDVNEFDKDFDEIEESESNEQ